MYAQVPRRGVWSPRRSASSRLPPSTNSNRTGSRRAVRGLVPPADETECRGGPGRHPRKPLRHERNRCPPSTWPRTAALPRQGAKGSAGRRAMGSPARDVCTTYRHRRQRPPTPPARHECPSAIFRASAAMPEGVARRFLGYSARRVWASSSSVAPGGVSKRRSTGRMRVPCVLRGTATSPLRAFAVGLVRGPGRSAGMEVVRACGTLRFHETRRRDPSPTTTPSGLVRQAIFLPAGVRAGPAPSDASHGDRDTCGSRRRPL